MITNFAADLQILSYTSKEESFWDFQKGRVDVNTNVRFSSTGLPASMLNLRESLLYVISFYKEMRHHVKLGG